MRELTGHFDGCGLTELCRVIVADEPHPVNGANHTYVFLRDVQPKECMSGYETVSGLGIEAPELPVACVGMVQFQRGPRDVADSDPGTLDGAVLSALIDRRESFQAGPYGCEQNARALELLREVRRLDIERAHDRRDRGVLGKNEK
mgnify:CR=1 FL=1